ncbi:MAG TPA: Rho termination factor N-terminal domain-containing protein [Baekduia sp.]|nr:Rho termination factor N-terminal domain-containing protein [Baekduia sp.]
MSVLTRTALEDSPLADLHAIASELGIDGYRRLRKPDLVARILERQGGTEAPAEAEAEVEVEAEEERPRRRRGTRGGRTRRKGAEEEGVTDEGAGAEAVATEDEVVEEELEEEAAERATAEEEVAERRPRRRRGGREREAEAEGEREERIAEGVVELLANGSGFVRVAPPEPSDDDIYISAAQVRRCELVSGDRVTGPVREPRRSERYPSLVRVDTINGRPADEVAEGTHFEDLPCGLPTERFALGSEDPTLKAIEWLTPIGKGSRVTITGPAHAGKTEALRRLAGALAEQDGVEVQVVLAGARPEECVAWRDAGIEPAAVATLGAGVDAQAQAVERAIDTAKRITARGGDVVVLVDALDGLAPLAAQRVLAAARNVVDGGSLTVIAAAAAPVGGETTIVALDPRLTRTGRFPALDLGASGTMRPELLVGDEGAEAIASARGQSLGL